jgi:phosphatidylethanolamine-binding protein (PEBP) family uncharacterized protein
VIGFWEDLITKDALALPENVSLETFTKAVEQNSLATAKLVGTFTQGKTK